MSPRTSACLPLLQQSIQHPDRLPWWVRFQDLAVDPPRPSPDESLPLHLRQSLRTDRPTFHCTADRNYLSYRPLAVENAHDLTLANQREIAAQLIFHFGYLSLFHMAMIAK